MADAIIPVPIYDHQYLQAANLCLMAKSIKDYSGVTSVTAEVGVFNIGFMMQLDVTYGSNIYYQVYPLFLIIPNFNGYLPIKHTNGSSGRSVNITSTNSSISITTWESYAVSFIFAVIE